MCVCVCVCVCVEHPYIDLKVSKYKKCRQRMSVIFNHTKCLSQNFFRGCFFRGCLYLKNMSDIKMSDMFFRYKLLYHLSEMSQ